MGFYEPDRSLRGKLRRQTVRLQNRRPVVQRAARPMLSICFDDAPACSAEAGRAVLDARGVKGTWYISGGLLGTDSPAGPVALADHVRALAYGGHEIGCHTYSHLDCGPESAAKVAAEFERNRDCLAELGCGRPTTFAYPYGEVTQAAKSEAARRFAVSRALHPGLIERGADLNQAPAISIEGEDGESRGLRWMARAAERSAWLVLFAHGVEPAPAQFACSVGALERLLDAALARGFDVLPLSEGAVRLGAAVH